LPRDVVRWIYSLVTMEYYDGLTQRYSRVLFRAALSDLAKYSIRKSMESSIVIIPYLAACHFWSRGCRLVLNLYCYIPNFINIGWFFAEIWRYNDFQHGGRSPFWICCDVIILHQGIHFHRPNIVLNFYVDWFCTFWHTCTCNIIYWHFGCIGLLMDHANLGLCMGGITWFVFGGVKSNPVFGLRIPRFLFTM